MDRDQKQLIGSVMIMLYIVVACVRHTELIVSAIVLGIVYDRAGETALFGAMIAYFLLLAIGSMSKRPRRTRKRG